MCCDCWYDVVFADTVNFLGISIVGQSNKGGDGGIYVGSIMKGWVKPEIPNVPLNIYDLVFCLCKIMSICSVYYCDWISHVHLFCILLWLDNSCPPVLYTTGGQWPRMGGSSRGTWFWRSMESASRTWVTMMQFAPSERLSQNQGKKAKQWEVWYGISCKHLILALFARKFSLIELYIANNMFSCCDAESKNH